MLQKLEIIYLLEELDEIITSSRRRSGKRIIIDKHVTERICTASGINAFRSIFGITYDNYHQLRLSGSIRAEERSAPDVRWTSCNKSTVRTSSVNMRSLFSAGAVSWNRNCEWAAQDLVVLSVWVSEWVCLLSLAGCWHHLDTCYALCFLPHLRQLQALIALAIKTDSSWRISQHPASL